MRLCVRPHPHPLPLAVFDLRPRHQRHGGPLGNCPVIDTPCFARDDGIHRLVVVGHQRRHSILLIDDITVVKRQKNRIGRKRNTRVDSIKNLLHAHAVHSMRAKVVQIAIEVFQTIPASGVVSGRKLRSRLDDVVHHAGDRTFPDAISKRLRRHNSAGLRS